MQHERTFPFIVCALACAQLWYLILFTPLQNPHSVTCSVWSHIITNSWRSQKDYIRNRVISWTRLTRLRWMYFPITLRHRGFIALIPQKKSAVYTHIQVKPMWRRVSVIYYYMRIKKMPKIRISTNCYTADTGDSFIKR